MTPTTDVAASVIVRSMNKATTIRATMESLRQQTVPIEIIVVDSGSTDRTLDVVRPYADRIIHIRPGDFSYGLALNLGAEQASAEIHFALSAHCEAPGPTWVVDSLLHYKDPLVAGTNGCIERPDGSEIDHIYFPNLSESLANYAWGFSNHASSWRASVWRERPFNDRLPACEDKEWFWWGLQAGWRFAFDPKLTVPSTHRRKDGLRSLWLRTYRESQALALLNHPPRPNLGTTFRSWWHEFPYQSQWPRTLRRLSPHRAAEYFGSHAGSRSGLRTLNQRSRVRQNIS